jgi:putative tricarboxylic transport membrane protein
MRKMGFDAAPFCFAMIIGNIMETSLRQSLLHSYGSFKVFFTRPISATLMAMSFILLLVQILPMARSRRSLLAEKLSDS